MKPFELLRPETVEEAVRLRNERPMSAFYAGGTELLLAMKKGFLHYDALIDVKKINSLAQLAVDQEEGVFRIGAAVTHRQVELDPAVRWHLPLLAEAERTVANARVRTAGTLGGNLCFAEPHSDIAVLALLMNADVVLHNGERRRRLPVASFLLGPYETALEPGELLEELVFPLPPPLGGMGYSRFKWLERPSAAAGVFLQAAGDRIAAARVVVGCAGPSPAHLPEAEEALLGARLSDLDGPAAAAGEKASQQAVVMANLAGSEDYKRHLLGVLVQRSCRQAVANLRKGE